MLVLNRQPEYCNWAFNLPRGTSCLEKWDAIPEDTDILITHTPPVGHGDLCCTGVRAGCVDLLSTVQTRVKPKYHVFGHIHEGEFFREINSCRYCCSVGFQGSKISCFSPFLFLIFVVPSSFFSPIVHYFFPL